MLPVYEKLFDIILNTSIVPNAWTMGIIHPIYKKIRIPVTIDRLVWLAALVRYLLAL